MGDSVVSGAYATRVARLIMLQGVPKSYEKMKLLRASVSNAATDMLFT